MSDETQSTAVATEIPSFSTPEQSPPPPAKAAAASGAASDRPELIAAGAFAAGFLLARILRGRGD